MAKKGDNKSDLDKNLIQVTEKAKKWPGAKVELRPVGSLKPYEKNARTHSPGQIAQIVNSIKQWGWTNPVLATEEGLILAGHGRVLAAEALGYAEVPVMIADGWSEEQQRAYIIADNKLALNAGWDKDLLASELSDLEGFGFAVDLIGFSADELADLRPASEKYLTDPDEVPDPGPAPVSRADDVWILGPHRLVCSDSTGEKAFQLLMGEGFADACWTDPPYNVDYEGTAGSIENDNLPDEAFASFLLDAFVGVHGRLKPGSAMYVAHADVETLNFLAAFKSAGFKLSSIVIWAKNSLVLGRRDYQTQHEPVLYGWKPGDRHRWYGDRKKTSIIELEGETFAVNRDGSLTVRVGQQTMRLTGKDIAAEAIEPTVIRVEKPSKSKLHPTMKPVELIERMLRNSTREGDVVLDPFGGSGSTLICCEMMGRQARLIELDGKFCDVIVKRWQEFTGQKATLEGDGRNFDAVSAARFGSES